MKVRINIILGSAVLLLASSAMARPYRQQQGSAAPVILSRAAILVDNQTGRVLWENNADVPLPPASTTKVMTAMLALQSGRLDQDFAVSQQAALAPASKISLRPGWRMRLEDLVYAILLNSANDASVVIAEGLSGSVENFAARMNTRARTLGANNTHFVNPNGLPADNHYSTARDLATIFGFAMRDPNFVRIVGTRQGVISPTSGSRRRIGLRTHNRLLGTYRINVVGKTGWTRAAKKCFVGSASLNGREMTVAVLGSRDLWGDVKRLLEFGFDGTTAPSTDPFGLQMASTSFPGSTGGGDEIDTPQNGTQYSLRLGTFQSYRAASRVHNSVQERGYPVRIEKLSQKRRSLYRVAVGKYSDRREAERAARKLRQLHRGLTIVAAR